MNKRILSYFAGLAVYLIIIIALTLLCVWLNLFDSSFNPALFVVGMLTGKIVADLIVYALNKKKSK